MTNTGLTASSAFSILSSFPVHKISIFPARAPILSARERICDADSSPDTYSTRPPVCAAAAVCKSNVDFPMPGSPPTRTAERFMAPPPSTRSNSPIPVEMRVPSSGSTAVSGIGFVCSPPGNTDAPEAPADPPVSYSMNEFHSPHSGQRPSQRGCVYPHELHLKAVVSFFFFAISIRDQYSRKAGRRPRNVCPVFNAYTVSGVRKKKTRLAAGPGRLRDTECYSDLISIFLVCASGFRGILTVRMPFLKLAATCSVSTSSGSVKRRLKEVDLRSLMSQSPSFSSFLSSFFEDMTSDFSFRLRSTSLSVNPGSSISSR